MKKNVYDEVYAILCALGDDYVTKVPMDFLNYITTNKSHNMVTIDKNKPLEDQNLSRETVLILAILKHDYWCETEEEKAELLQILETNELKLQERLASATSPKEFMKLLRRK